jgi:acetyl-CoA C-acetyltransferase
VDEVILGCVLSAGLGQAPARQAAVKAGIPVSVPATTVNKVCGSAMKAVMYASDQIRAGSAEIVIAGGIESMTNAPYLLPKARQGYRMGHGEILDHMIYDGLQSPFDGRAMGTFGDSTAKKYGYTREELDAYAAETVRRAQGAVASGAFKAEITPVTVKTRKGEVVVDTDETPGTCNIAKIPTLKPAFNKDGLVTAASSSSISDGAAVLTIMSSTAAEKVNAKPLARILGYTTHAQEPEWFTTAPGAAIQKLMKKVGWSLNDVDLFEINEAFGVVAMAAMRDVGIPHSKLNVNGGACALGHPIGASGARILTTLIYALKARNLRRGIAAICLAGGEATAIAIELV